jgi:uncharacterized protein
VASQFRLELQRSVHGPDHWDRVHLYGALLCTETGADPLVVRLFALLHDSQRESESRDPEHGPRAAEFARSLDLGLDDLQLKRLVLACRDHERGYTSNDATIGTCWDSDRLDLDRVLVVCDEAYMSTGFGKRLGNLRPHARQKLAGIRQ